jgi:hypothetical protein
MFLPFLFVLTVAVTALNLVVYVFYFVGNRWKHRKRPKEIFLNGTHKRVGRAECLCCGKVVYTGMAWAQADYDEDDPDERLFCCGWPMRCQDIDHKDGHAIL